MMHAPVNSFLIMTLVILSLFQFQLLLPSPILVTARKLSSNGAVFSVDLIRRNSSRTAIRGGGRGRASLGSVSYSHKITLSSTFYENKDVQTEVIPDGGEYDMKFSIGTPPVEFTAVADTGSDLVWVQCSPCQQCIPQKTPLFDPTKSSTDKTIACTSPVCDGDQLYLRAAGCASSSNDNSCIYVAGYGDGTETSGKLSTETITFPSTSFPNFVFGCGYDQKGSVGPQGDGIVGLGGGPLSLVSQLGPQINYKFSYCLTPASSGVNSKLNFGLDVTGSGTVSTPFTTQDQPTYYYLTLNSISIGDTSVTAATNIIIDSGSTLTYLPSDVYDGVSTAVKAAIPLSPVADPNQMYDPCYETESLDGFPDVVFHFSGADVVLKAENTFRTSHGIACMAIVPTDDTYIFGNVAQTNFHVGYDLQANQVSFAPADCTQF